MVDIKYANAYSEVLEILKYIPIEDYNKIPNSKIELFETNANKDYIFYYNPRKTLDEQSVSKIAKGIIAILFRDYWATEAQKSKIIEKQNYDRAKLEEEKKLRYNNNVFQNINNDSLEEINIITNTEMIKYKESFFKKVITKIKNILYKR